ncbi:MAG: type II toxin-antitoxin system HicB family antitoxin [bacterium]
MEYIQAALAKARYEIIEDEEPYYGEVADLQGVWATGKTLEECRKNLADVIDGWIVVRLKRGLPIPTIGAHGIEELKELEVHG